MLELLNMCGISVAGELTDGKWHMAKFSCSLVTSFGFFVRQVEKHELEFMHGNNKEHVDLGWFMQGRNMQEVRFALSNLIRHYMALEVETQYSDNLKKKVLA